MNEILTKMSCLLIFSLIFFLSNTDSLVGQPLITHLLYKVQHSISALRQSSVRNSFILFFGDQVLASQIKTKEEIFWVTPTP